MRRHVLIFLVACGSSGGSGGSDKLSAIPETKTMGDLTDIEKKQLCEDFKAYQKTTKPSGDETLRMTCQAKAAMSMMSNDAKDDAALRGACKKQLDDCIAKKEQMAEPELDCANPEFLGKMSECKQLTIGEITECVKDMAGLVKKLASDDLCAAMSATDKMAVMKIFDKLKSPKCEALEAKCSKPAAATGGPASEKLEKDTIAAIAGFKAKMCGCADKACAEVVRADMTTWGEKMAQEHSNFQPSPAASTQITGLVNDYTNCMLKIAGEGSSDSDAGSGSAK